MRGLPRRLVRQERRVLPESWEIVPIVAPRRWSAEVQAAYAAAEAAGDWDAQAAIVAAQTGERPSQGRRDGTPCLIEIRYGAPREEEARA